MAAKKQVPVNVTLVTVVFLVVIGIIAVVAIVNNGDKEERTVSAQGSVTNEVAPTEATVHVMVETSEDTAVLAKDENARISAEVMLVLDELGIQEEHIETLYYNSYPDYDWKDGERTLRGYRVSNTIEVKTEDLDVLGEIIDVAVEAGALVNNVQTDISETQKQDLKAAALEAAAADARKKAEAMANGLGKRLGKVLSVSTPDLNYQPYPMLMVEESGTLDAQRVDTEIHGKKITVTASVQVVYALV